MLDARPKREPATVLLIDDDRVCREVTATLLTMSGYTVHAAESGPASLKLIENGICDPNVILMDAQMPGLSGLELVRALRALVRRAAIYIVSGSEPSAELIASADGLLLKPYGHEALRKLLDGGGARLPQDGRSSSPTGSPVVSPDVLAQLRQTMPEAAVREIFVAVAADLGGRIEALGAAIARRDAAEIRRIGHAIKGGCGMAGVIEAARIGEQLENLPSVPEDNDLDDSRALLSELRASTRALERILKEGPEL